MDPSQVRFFVDVELQKRATISRQSSQDQKQKIYCQLSYGRTKRIWVQLLFLFIYHFISFYHVLIGLQFDQLTFAKMMPLYFPVTLSQVKFSGFRSLNYIQGSKTEKNKQKKHYITFIISNSERKEKRNPSWARFEPALSYYVVPVLSHSAI